MWLESRFPWGPDGMMDPEGGGGQGGEQEGLEIQGGGPGRQEDILPALW